ncbi:MAG: cytochrome c biogenesis protein ResB [Planctomycetes bacterium]|nr:cytochrome c biogenesis protein ResB [Planctomycetota bacterium]
MRLLRPLGSLRLTLAVLVSLAVILIAATWLSGYDITLGSLRRDLYGSWWFNVLLAVLMVNLVACTVIRKPWRFWQWGFLLTHTGVLTLMVGAGVSFNWKIYGDMAISEGGHASEFEIEGEREVIVHTARGEDRFPVDVNPYRRSSSGRVWRAKDGRIVRLLEYIPNVSQETAYETVPDGRFDVLHVRTYFQGKLFQNLYLPLGESVRNSLLSFFYVPEGLLETVGGTSGEQGTLVLTIDGERRELDVKENLDRPVRIGRRDVTIRRFYGAFMFGDAGAGENPEERDTNPTVMFEVRPEGGEPATYYAFALHPEMSPIRKGGAMHGGGAPDFEATLRYAARQSVVYFALGSSGVRYRVTTPGGTQTSGSIAPGERIRHPGMAMPLEFEVVRHLHEAEPALVEEAPRKGAPAQPAVRVKMTGAPLWLRLGQAVQIDEDTTLQFVPRTYTGLSFAVQLVRFINPPYEGTGRASKFESELRIHDATVGKTIDGKTGVNYPFSYRGWSFYQSTFNDKVTPVMSILQVAYDPGKRILYLGCIMTAFGALFMMLLKRSLAELVKGEKQAIDAPMGMLGRVGSVALASAGAVGGAVALLIAPWIDGLALGSAASIGGVAMSLALTGVAHALRSRRPRWALGLGQAVSAGWCINVAALVLFMLVRMP